MRLKEAWCSGCDEPIEPSSDKLAVDRSGAVELVFCCEECRVESMKAIEDEDRYELMSAVPAILEDCVVSS